MRFRFELVPSLPRLAWCARLSRGDAEILVIHGPWVETRATCFFEGVWDAPFAELNFDKAHILAGSGGKIRGEEVVFCGPTDKFAGLHSIRVADTLLVSNSLVFLLTQAGDSPDPGYPWYLFDNNRSKRWGLRRPHCAIPTRLGHTVDIQLMGNLAVSASLDIRREEQGKPVPPADFAGHRDMLVGALERLFENGADGGRAHPFRPVTSVSRGYDSPAVSALAARAGCREAICFSNTYDPQNDDDGTGIAHRLGLQVHPARRDDFLKLPGFPEAEFCATVTMGTGAPFAVLEPALEGALLLSGFTGDTVWSVDPRNNLPDGLAPGYQGMTMDSYNEFRLRTGCAVFALPQIGRWHMEEIFRITHSDEMKPWWVAGKYNRPIPRRILEEAGVPRGTFAQAKVGGGHSVIGREDGMKPESRADFLEFYRAQPIPGWFRQGRVFGWRDVPAILLERLYTFSHRYPGREAWLYKFLLPLTLNSDRRYRDTRTRSPYLYLFHWGFERIRERYRIPGD